MGDATGSFKFVSGYDSLFGALLFLI